jgi:Dr1-associated corepressor
MSARHSIYEQFFAYSRKHAVETTETLDFLKEIVETIPDPSAGGTIDIESQIAEAAKKKRGKGKKAGATGEQPTKRRRKKQEAEAEAEGSGEGDGEMKSEADGDVVMHDVEGVRREKNGKAGYRPQSPGSDDEDGSDDRPFIPGR